MSLRSTFAWIAVAGVTLGCSSPSLCEDGAGCRTISELRDGAALEGEYTIVDRDGNPLASVGGERRLWIFLDALPPTIPAAWVAVEDRRFREHGGVDFRGVARATVVNLKEGAVVEGASTIPMQLVRILWPEAMAGRGPWGRKTLEARTAPRLVSELGRDRVLELYLNAIYMGDGQYGIGAAASHYFGVKPSDLTLSQLATLVGMTKTPESFHPRDHPDRAKARRDVVLGILLQEGVADSVAVAGALSSTVRLTDDNPLSRERSYVTSAVLSELRRAAPELVDRGGITLHTTIDPRVQNQTVALVGEHLERISAGEYGRFLGGDEPVQAAAIVMESATGAILAVVGGRDFATTPFNRALQSRRPVGSLAKPLILAAALQQGLPVIRPLSTAQLVVDTRDGLWRPRDHVSAPYVLPHDMVVHSSNRAAVRLGQEVGVRAFASFVRTLGVEVDIPPFPSSFLGAFDASLAEMTGAFAAFENGGNAVKPYFIQRITDAAGRSVWSRPGAAMARRVIAMGNTDLVLDAMRGVVDEGTGTSVRRYLQGAAAGKTGTTADGADAWFVGVRPGLAAGVWIGLDRPAPIIEDGGGGRLAAPLWGLWMAALAPLGYGEGEWSVPDRLRRVSLGERPEGDSIRYCWGGDGPARLVPEWALRDMRVCEPEPVPQRTEDAWDDLGADRPFPRPGSDTITSGGIVQ